MELSAHHLSVRPLLQSLLPLLLRLLLGCLLGLLLRLLLGFILVSLRGWLGRKHISAEHGRNADDQKPFERSSRFAHLLIPHS